MGIAAEVIEQMLGRAKRLFGVDNPGLLVQLFEQVVEGFRIGQRSGLTWEAKHFFSEGLLEKVEELTLEDDTESFDMEEEVFTGRDPAVLIERQSTLGDKAVEMEMIQQDLVPGMQYSSKAQGTSEVNASEV